MEVPRMLEESINKNNTVFEGMMDLPVCNLTTAIRGKEQKRESFGGTQFKLQIVENRTNSCRK